MANIPAIYDLLARSDHPAADDALREALPLVSEPYRSMAARTLLHRASTPGMVGLVAHFQVLTDDLRQDVVVHSALMSAALESALHEPDVETRVNALTILRRSGNPRLADLANLGLKDGTPRVRQAAAEALRALVDNFFDRQSDVRTVFRDPEVAGNEAAGVAVEALRMLTQERESLLRAVSAGLATFSDHHRMEALEAAMFFAHELTETLLDHAGQRRGGHTAAMIEVFENSDDRRLSPFAYVALTRAETRAPILRRLELRCDSEFFHQMIRDSFLVREPQIRRAFAAVRRLSWLASGIESVLEMPAELLPRFPAWLTATGLPPEMKMDILTQIATGENPSAAAAAIFELSRMTSQSAARGLDTAARQGSGVVQRMAIRALKHRRRLSERSRRLAHLRAIGAKNDALFDSAWSTFDRLDANVAQSIGRRARTQMKEFGNALRARLCSRSAEDRTRAVRMVMALGLSGDLLNEVAALSSDEDITVRSTVMSALSAAGGPTARRIFERALLDADPRVVANAVEGLDRLGSTTRLDMLTPLMEHDDNRIRGNAIRALLHRRVPEAAGALLSMLSDPRRMHRISALWLVERMRLTAMRERVHGVSQCDPDMSVRRAATQTLHRLSKRLETAIPAVPAPAPAGDLA